MYSSFRENLTDVVRAGEQAGAEVLLMTVPVNLRDCPLFASADPANAANEFRVAHDLLASGKTEEALVQFRRARDFDTLRFRADSKINEIIRETALAANVRLVDAEKSFGLTGNDLFWEHVHFTPAGTFRLANLVANELGVTNTPDFDQVRAALPVTTWDERNLRLQIAGLLRRPPFKAQAGNAKKIAELQTDVDIAAIFTEARPAFEAAIQQRPNDFHMLGRYASLLREMGSPKASADIFAGMIRLLPGRKAWHVSRGAALSEAGERAAAVDEYKAALAIDSRFDLAHFGLGSTNARIGRHEQAVRHYEEALQFNPTYAEAAYHLAGSLAALGRTGEAKRQLERAVATRPNFARAHAALAQLHAKEGVIEEAIRHYRHAVEGDAPLPEAHYDLGVLLSRQGRLEEAIVQYQKAMQRRPDFPDALNNLGIALAKKGDAAGAAQAFERALTLEPSFEAARSNLRRIRGKVARH
jgi:tetratricopeptide (TPR) repeat protein